MANSITLNGFPGVEAEQLSQDLLDTDHPKVPPEWLLEANRFMAVVGATPGRGSILLRASDLDQIDLTKALDFTITDQFGLTRRLPNLRAAGNPRCLQAGSTEPVYQVFLTDRKNDLVAQTNLRYHWRFHPTDVIAESHTTGTGANWSAVIQALWNLLVTDLGTWPGLPATVLSATTTALDQLDLQGFRVIDALEDCLAAVGCALNYDPLKDTFGIVHFAGATDKATDFFVRYRPRLMFDESPYQPKIFGAIPANVVVLFPAWKGARYGTNPLGYYACKYNRPTDLTWAQGHELVESTVYLQDFTPCRLKQDDTVQTATTLQTRANQVGRNFYLKLTETSPQWPIKRAYEGIIEDPDFLPGATFDAVGWGLTSYGAMTLCARSGLVGCTELYSKVTISGGNGDYLTTLNPSLLRNADGSVRRVGGYAADMDRLDDTLGNVVNAKGDMVSLAGWNGLSPLLKRNSALRQCDWSALSTGAKTEPRARLWRNWETFGPDDMTRFVRVTSATTSTITVNGHTVAAYPGKVLQSSDTPTNWPQEETVWVVDANGATLATDTNYLAKQGVLAADGKAVWGVEVTAGSGSLEYEEFIPNTNEFTSDNTWEEITTFRTTVDPAATYIQFPSTGVWQVDMNVYSELDVYVTPMSGFTPTYGALLFMRISTIGGVSSLLVPDPAPLASSLFHVYLNTKIDLQDDVSVGVAPARTMNGTASATFLVRVTTAETKALKIEAINNRNASSAIVSYTWRISNGANYTPALVVAISGPTTWLRAIKLSD